MRIFVSRFDDAGEASAAVRELLRLAVGEYRNMEMPPIEKDGKGKPFFVGTEGLHFSLSHTKTHILAAVSAHPVGADIESLRPVKKEYERLFSEKMLEDFGYFGGWTLREAVFKLKGEGSLRSMEFSLREGEIVSPFEGVRCATYSLPGCAIAVAAEEGDFPESIDLVEKEIFWPPKA